MAVRTVTVRMRAQFEEYLKAGGAAQRKTKDVREEVEKLDKAGNALSKSGLYSALGAVPALAAPAAAGLAVLPAFALSSAAAFGTLVVATNGVGEAMKAVAEGDGDKLAEAMKGLSGEARDFVRAYEQVRPVLADLGQQTQDPFFREAIQGFDLLTRTYLPVMLQQMPKVAGAWGAAARQTAEFASTPKVVGQVNRQFELGVGLVDDFGGLLRSGIALLLDMADAGGEFSRELVQGTTRGTDAFRRWLETARGTGQINDLFDNARRILAQLTDVAAEAGDVMFDAMANPALADATGVFLDIVGMLLQVLHGVLQVFEMLPAGMQSTVATTIAVGAAVLILAGRLVALKAALDSAKTSAISAGAALKGVGGFLAGPWGIAISVATVAIGLFAAGNAAAEADVADFRDTLDEQTGAFTANTRAMVVNKLEQEGVLRAARNMGLDLTLVTDAAMGNAAAVEELNRQLALMPSYANTEKIQDGVGGISTALEAAQESQSRFKEGMGATGTLADATTGKYRTQEAAVKSLGITLRAQTDPAFALIKAQKDMRKAQADYNEAVKEHGPKSKEAKDASIELAEAAVILNDAVKAAATTFDGTLTPELKAAMIAAGMAAPQIKNVEKAMKDAKAAGDKFAGDYAANVTTPGLDAALAKLRELAVLARKMRSGVTVNAYDPEGLVTRRWGGITTYAATGSLRDAGIYSASSRPRYAFAERQTGGELFAPRIGDMNRTRALVSHAVENWWGGWQNFVPGGSSGAMAPATTIGGGGGGGSVIVHVQLIDPQTGRVTREKLVDDARGRGVPPGEIRTAYP